MIPFLQGGVAVACAVAGLFFLRFWKATRDRFFVYFALAFWVLAMHWTAIGLINPSSELRYQLYLPRLLAFVIIIVGIVDKNRRNS